jgi:hypothetical protein
LTLAAALSIVAHRSLEGVVRRLRAFPDGSTPAGLGLVYPFRLLLLVVLVTLLAVGGREPVALVLGLSAIPVAVLAEAGLQLAAVWRVRDVEPPGGSGSTGGASQGTGQGSGDRSES